MDIETLIEDNLSTLEEHFISLGEYGGTPIYKDNCEDLFDYWLQDLDEDEVKEIIK